jgi:hypothetical protein
MKARRVISMGRLHWRVVAFVVLSLGGTGCMSTPDARYVYQDGEYGVIGIPRNSSLGKKNYREQAEELMTRHFPEGYEIVRAEEVVEGERTLDTGRKLELETDPSVAAFNQLVKIGHLAKVESLDQKDMIKITESRIIYRRKHDGKATGKDGFTSVATLAPELYIDPNQVTRKELKDGTYLAKKENTTPSKMDVKVSEIKIDPTVQKASQAPSK